MESKSIFLSKTFWIGAALAAYSAFSTYLESFSNTDSLVGLVAGVLVVINRYFTYRPIK